MQLFPAPFPASAPRSPTDRLAPVPRRVGFGGEQGAFCASRALPSHCGQTFLLHPVLPASFWGSLRWGSEDGGEVCGHQTDLALGMLGEEQRDVE